MSKKEEPLAGLSLISHPLAFIPVNAEQVVARDQVAGVLRQGQYTRLQLKSKLNGLDELSIHDPEGRIWEELAGEAQELWAALQEERPAT